MSVKRHWSRALIHEWLVKQLGGSLLEVGRSGHELLLSFSLLGQFLIELVLFLLNHGSSESWSKLRLEAVLLLNQLWRLLLLAIGPVLHGRRHLGLLEADLRILPHPFPSLLILLSNLLLIDLNRAGPRDGIGLEVESLNRSSILLVSLLCNLSLITLPETEGLFSFLGNLNRLGPHGSSSGFFGFLDSLVSRDKHLRWNRLMSELE